LQCKSLDVGVEECLARILKSRWGSEHSPTITIA